MKLEISVKFIDECGLEVIKPVIIDTSVPNFDDFHDVNDFLPVFDQLERSGLRLRDEAFSIALTQYMETLSKKKLPKQEVIKGFHYIMETESGRLFMNLYLPQGGKEINDSIFPPTGPRERLASLAYEELSTEMCSLLSYRHADNLMNRILHRKQPDLVHLKTLSDFIERKGSELEEFRDNFTEETLKQYGFDSKTALPVVDLPLEITHPKTSNLPETKVEQTLEQCNYDRVGQEKADAARIHDRIENPEETTYISVDDIGVVKQKEKRGPNTSRDNKYIENTVIHIAAGIGHYILAGTGMEKMFHTLVAFLLSNHLMEARNLVFFTDGARNIRNNIEAMFPYRPYTILLDWYHLEKKCREYLSSALRGRKICDPVSKELLKYLWVGNVEYATDYLLHLEDNIVKNREWITKLVAYLDKNYSYIPCYALRKKLGLRNSSNPVEKANDTTVAQRQKHNGMSWSKVGSSALSNIRAMYLNGEDKYWFTKRQLQFKLLPLNEKLCS